MSSENCGALKVVLMDPLQRRMALLLSSPQSENSQRLDEEASQEQNVHPRLPMLLSR